LAHAGAGVCHFSTAHADARAAVGQARAAVAGHGARAQPRGSHGQLIAGRVEQAERAMREHLASYPRDLAVVQRLYFIWFWQGRFPEMLELTGTLIRHYPGNSFMLGLHAFALEEAQRMPEALATAEVAVARNRATRGRCMPSRTIYRWGRADGNLLPPDHPAHLGWVRSISSGIALMHFACGDYARAGRMSRAA
jgi:hypothetical protein